MPQYGVRQMHSGKAPASNLRDSATASAVRAGDRLCSSSKVSHQPGMTGARTLARPVPPSRPATVASQLSPAPPVFNSFDGLDAISPRVGPR